MNRRCFLQTTGTAGLGVLLPAFVTPPGSPYKKFSVSILKITTGDNIEIPAGKRIPFSWPAFGIRPGSSIVLTAPSIAPGSVYFLRISVAQEVRDEKLVQVSIPQTRIQLGTIKILYSSVLVPYEIEIPAKYIKLIQRNGLELKPESASPLWIFSEPDSENKNEIFLPHILSASASKETKETFINCFCSLNSIQSYGWREGAVLDGLCQLHALKGDKKALKTIKDHFGLFFKGNDLHYENGHSIPIFNQINGIESTLPYAILARLYPDHPMLDTALNGLYELKQPNGVIMDHEMISAEGCYTIAYPLAVVGRIRNDLTLMQESFSQLKHRSVLYHNNALFLRVNNNSVFTFRNWARGIAWHLLGFVRTITELKNHLYDESLIKQLQDEAELAVSMQRKDGLWSCFADEKETLPDTSGSAGIAAAILTGVREGILPECYRGNALRCWEALQQYITPDGFLKGVAQDNRGGIKLQKSDYRVIGQMGMGLMAQLAAEI